MTATRNDLEGLHKLVAQELTRRISTGEATAAEFTAALKFLKDNEVANINLGEVADLSVTMADFNDSDLPENVLKMK